MTGLIRLQLCPATGCVGKHLPIIGYADVYANASITVLTAVGVPVFLWFKMTANISGRSVMWFCRLRVWQQTAKHAEPV